MAPNGNHEATILREQAGTHVAAAERSFQECDTDGALSQWADTKIAEELRLKAQVIEQGGLAAFPALFNLRGERVRAKLINGQYGPCWRVELGDGRVRFTGAFPARTSTMERKGFREGTEKAPAKIGHTEGRGLSGAASLRFFFERADKGYPDDAVFGADW